MRTALFAALSLGLSATTAVGQAAPSPTALSLAAAIQAVEAKGYSVVEIDREGRWLEVEALTPEGASVEMILDATTAEIQHQAVED